MESVDMVFGPGSNGRFMDSEFGFMDTSGVVLSPQQSKPLPLSILNNAACP